MNMMKDHVSSNLFSKAYASQAFAVVKDKAIWPVNITSITLWIFFWWFFFVNIYLTLYKWKIFGVYSDEFLSIKTNLVMKNAILYPFCTHRLEKELT